MDDSRRRGSPEAIGGLRSASGVFPMSRSDTGVTPLTSMMFEMGLVSRVSPVHTAMRNCTRDEGRPFEVGNQVLISSRRKLLSSKATVVNVAEKSEQDFGRHG